MGNKLLKNILGKLQSKVRKPGKWPSADNRIGFRVSTHAMYNTYDQNDYMFDRLVAGAAAAEWRGEEV